MSKFLDNLSIIFCLFSVLIIFILYIIAAYTYLIDYFVLGHILTFMLGIIGIVIGIIALIKKTNQNWKPIVGIILGIILLIFGMIIRYSGY